MVWLILGSCLNATMVSLLATNHPVGKGVASNKGTKKLSAASLYAVFGDPYGAECTALMSMKDEDGRPLKCKS